MIPIICIGNYHIDKKITEMMKVCTKIELKTPNNNQVNEIVKLLMPKLEADLIANMVQFIQGDMRKLKHIHDIYTTQQSILKNKIITNMLQPKTYNEDTKQITKRLLNNKYSINDHMLLMNETDSTSVGLLFHENIIDVLEKIPKNIAIPFYIKILNNLCFADYVDRITFQKQIWIFNEMSSLIKTFYNHALWHDLPKKKPVKFNPEKAKKLMDEYMNAAKIKFFASHQLDFIKQNCQKLFLMKKGNLTVFEDVEKGINFYTSKEYHSNN